MSEWVRGRSCQVVRLKSQYLLLPIWIFLALLWHRQTEPNSREREMSSLWLEMTIFDFLKSSFRGGEFDNESRRFCLNAVDVIRRTYFYGWHNQIALRIVKSQRNNNNKSKSSSSSSLYRRFERINLNFLFYSCMSYSDEYVNILCFMWTGVRARFISDGLQWKQVLSIVSSAQLLFFSVAFSRESDLKSININMKIGYQFLSFRT